MEIAAQNLRSIPHHWQALILPDTTQRPDTTTFLRIQITIPQFLSPESSAPISVHPWFYYFYYTRIAKMLRTASLA
jgi:hypothetical protein